MAKKIFRLHEGGATESTGWFHSGIITSDHLKTIKTQGKDVATSIPTPFATIDLVKSAFKWVAENEIIGDTAHHKLVSDALDVGQLFYSYHKFKSKIRIVAWDPNYRFKEMVEHGRKAHKNFSETLQLFWNQDSVDDANLGNEVIYNYEKVKRLYFVLNKENNLIIGGTSPATLFFASPDARRFTKDMNFVIGQDELFDNEYASLIEREPSFIKYFYTLSKQLGFATVFPELYDYLERAKDGLDHDLRKSISEIEAQDIEKYGVCSVLDNENDVCEVLNMKLGVQKIDIGSISSDSDFVIKSDFLTDDIKPLILPQYPFSKRWTYTTRGVIWDERTRVPYKNTMGVNNSKLPVQNDPYYWLSMGNLLEDDIFELPYPIDGSKFITCGSNRYLLPVSSVFFKYFEAKKINQYLSIKERSGGNVDVKLKIPVKGGEVIFKKQYSQADQNIQVLHIYLAIFPFLKSNMVDLNYNIGLIDDRSNGSPEVIVSCFNEGRYETLQNPIIRNPGEPILSSKYYNTSKYPDVIGVSMGSTSGFIIPIMEEARGTSSISFAVDFGTTNTHIEYRCGDNDSVSLDNTTDLPFWQSLLDRSALKKDPVHIDNENVFEQEIIPYTFSDTGELGFPFRTALVYNKDSDFNNKTEIIREVNNYLLLDKNSIPGYLELKTQLKWSNYSSISDEKKVESYLTFLALIVFIKTLQLGGDPSKTNITWFYPVSMDEGELGVFSKLWLDVYKDIFNQTTNKRIIGLPESIAPYLFYKSSVEGLSLSIDIGGGSSDIAVFDEDDSKAKLISSFKFAGNAIFGDGYPSKEYRNNSDRNGFVKLFRQDAIKVVGNIDNPIEEKEKILYDILNVRKNSADFSNYLFAIEHESKSNFSYSRLLQKNNVIKMTFFVFYGAIAYYSAQLLKKAKIEIPKYILLSGTGSKTSTILDSNIELNNLSCFFQFVFEKVFDRSATQSLQIKLSSIPKEVTCKGALKADINNSFSNPPIKFWIGGIKDSSCSELFDREKDVQKTPRYGEIDEEKRNDIEDSIKHFYSILDDYVETIRIESKFIIDQSAYKVFVENRDIGIKDFLQRGIKAYYKKSDTKVEETLFFYPLIGILNKLSYELAKKNDE